MAEVAAAPVPAPNVTPERFVVFAPLHCPLNRLLVAAAVLWLATAIGYAFPQWVDDEFLEGQRSTPRAWIGLLMAVLGLVTAFLWDGAKFVVGFWAVVRGVNDLLALKRSIKAGEMPSLPLVFTLSVALFAVCTYACHRCFYILVAAEKAKKWRSEELVRAPRMTPIQYRLLTGCYFVGMTLTSDYMDWANIAFSFCCIWYWKCGKYIVYSGAVFWLILSVGGYLFGPTLVDFVNTDPRFPDYKKEFLEVFFGVMENEVKNPSSLSDQFAASGLEVSTVLKKSRTLLDDVTVYQIKELIHDVALFALRRVVFGTLGEWFLFLCVWRTRAEVAEAELATANAGVAAVLAATQKKKDD